MFTLDSNVSELVEDRDCSPKSLCRTTLRLRRAWADDTLREFLARPPQSAIVAGLDHVKLWLWHRCDDELKTAITTYLEKARA